MSVPTPAASRRSQSAPHSTDPEQRRAALLMRLEDGYQQIEQALQDGKDVTRWEELWLKLLDEYERICDSLQESRQAA